MYNQTIYSPAQRQPQMFGTRLISNRQQPIINHLVQSPPLYQQQIISNSTQINNSAMIVTSSPKNYVAATSNLIKSVSNPSPTARMMIKSRVQPMRINELVNTDNNQMTLQMTSPPRLIKQNSDPIHSLVKKATVRTNATNEARLNLASVKRTESSMC
jgi:hypothetical protein